MGVVLLGSLIALPLATDVFWGGEQNTEQYATHRVESGTMRVSIVATGELDSMQNVVMSSQLEGTATITEIIPEGSLVLPPVIAQIAGEVTERTATGEDEASILVKSPDGETVAHSVPLGEHTKILVKPGDTVSEDEMLAGDLVCVLNPTTLTNELKSQQIKVTQARAAFAQARENLAIQQNQNESDLATADLNLTLAKLDLEKFQEGDYGQQLGEIEGEIKLAQEQLIQAQEKYEFTRRTAKKGYSTQSELEADRLAVTQAEINLNVAEEKKRVLERFTAKRTIAELEANARDFVLEKDRVRRKGLSALAQFEADVDATQLTLEVEESKLQRLQEQIDASRMYAPVGGEIVYANENNHRGPDRIIEKQAEVKERQAIVKLPNLDQMKVDAAIHESKVSRVAVGQQVIVRIDAYPDETFTGRVHSVSSVPASTNYFNRDLKQYDTEIELLDIGDRERRLRPGLSANVEIVVEEHPDSLQVPQQAVITIGDDHVVYQLDSDGANRTPVTIGDANESNIQILDGLRNGDEVLTNPRTHFSKEITRLKDKAAEKSGNDESSESEPSGEAE